VHNDEITLHAKLATAALIVCRYMQIYAANRCTINNLHNAHSSQDNHHEIWICPVEVCCQVMFIDLDFVHFVGCHGWLYRGGSRSIFSLDSFMHNWALHFDSKPNPS
jgi:hypothetical protein